LPGAVLFDLDDTLLDTSGGVAACRERTVASSASHLPRELRQVAQSEISAELAKLATAEGIRLIALAWKPGAG
jgi:FMN phosphatase YigB (HAD superfamily)